MYAHRPSYPLTFSYARTLDRQKIKTQKNKKQSTEVVVAFIAFFDILTIIVTNVGNDYWLFFFSSNLVRFLCFLFSMSSLPFLFLVRRQI